MTNIKHNLRQKFKVYVTVEKNGLILCVEKPKPNIWLVYRFDSTS